MKRHLLLLLTLCLALPLQAAEDFRDIKWEVLVPKGWDPSKDLKALDLGKLQDNDPRAMEALDKIRQMWDNAPTDPALAGARVRLPGPASTRALPHAGSTRTPSRHPNPRPSAHPAAQH